MLACLLFLDFIKIWERQEIFLLYYIFVIFYEKFIKIFYDVDEEEEEEVVDVEDFEDVDEEEVVDVEDFEDVFISGDSAATGFSSCVFLSKSPPGNDETVDVFPVEAPAGKGFFEVPLPSILFPKDDRP